MYVIWIHHYREISGPTFLFSLDSSSLPLVQSSMSFIILSFCTRVTLDLSECKRGEGRGDGRGNGTNWWGSSRSAKMLLLLLIYCSCSIFFSRSTHTVLFDRRIFFILALFECCLLVMPSLKKKGRCKLRDKMDGHSPWVSTFQNIDTHTHMIAESGRMEWGSEFNSIFYVWNLNYHQRLCLHNLYLPLLLFSFRLHIFT